jgi:hypothetical protein
MSLRPLGKTLLLLSLTLSGAAFASPVTDEANLHFKAIAGGDVYLLMRGYDKDASLQWVGGPLDGVYKGDARLRELWTKFSAAQGELEHKVSDLQESANPKGATVTANVEFKGKATIKVRYVLTYRDGKLVNEIWQIDPNLAVSY